MKVSEVIYKVSGAFSKTTYTREDTKYSSGRKEKGGGVCLAIRLQEEPFWYVQEDLYGAKDKLQQIHRVVQNSWFWVIL